MKILITSPLYPPDIAEPAPYIKELAKRLKDRHEVTIITYGNLPEKIDSVNIYATSKQKPLILRLINYFILLTTEGKDTDIVYSENGPSVELPVALYCFLSKKQLVLHLGDQTALSHSKQNMFYKTIHRFIQNIAKETIDKRLPLKPEVLPFEKTAESDVADYELKWTEHIEEIENVITKYER